MGVAILWIFLFHSGVVLPGWMKPLAWLKQIGYGGVDIFLLLSGLGLYFSLSNDAGLLRYYRARFVRIMPTYWLVVSIAMLLDSWVLHTQRSYLELFQIFSMVGFWLNAAKFDWFIPSVVVLYAVFPLYFRIFQRSEHKALLTLSVAATSLLLTLPMQATRFAYLLIFATRIPIFLLGVYFGYLIKAEKAAVLEEKLVTLPGALSFAIGAASLAFVFKAFTGLERWAYGLWWYPFIFITPVLCAWVARAFEWSARFEPGRTLIAWLDICGRYSLEIYLVHLTVFGLHEPLDRYFVFDPSQLVMYALFFMFTLPVSIALGRFVGVTFKPLLTHLRP